MQCGRRAAPGAGPGGRGVGHRLECEQRAEEEVLDDRELAEDLRDRRRALRSDACARACARDTIDETRREDTSVEGRNVPRGRKLLINLAACATRDSSQRRRALNWIC